MAHVLDALASALTTAAAGATREQLEDVLAVLVMSAPPAQRDVDEEVELLLGRFAQRAGVDAAASPDEAQAAIARYLEATPPKVELLHVAARVAREHLGARGGAIGAIGNALARFSGDDGSAGVLGGVQPGQARPAGTTPAGPLARFLVDRERDATKKK